MASALACLQTCFCWASSAFGYTTTMQVITVPGPGMNRIRRCRRVNPVSSRRVTSRPTCLPANGIGSNWPGLIPQTLSKQSVRSQYNAASLAFLGDAVWESFLRQHYFGSGQQLLHKYHQDTKHHATAIQQAIHYDSLVAQARADDASADGSAADGGMGMGSAAAVSSLADSKAAGSTLQTLTLSEEELGVLRWARNGSTISPPRGMDALQYKKATAVEVLVAWLYLTDLERCHKLMQSLVAHPRGGKGKPPVMRN